MQRRLGWMIIGFVCSVNPEDVAGANQGCFFFLFFAESD
jgi:hypothetical protein